MNSVNTNSGVGINLDSDRDENAYGSESGDSEDLQDSRTTNVIKATSRKRESSDSSSDSEYLTDEDQDDSNQIGGPDHSTLHDASTSPKTKTPQSLDITLAQKPSTASKPIAKRGVIYISRIPPYLKPHTLRQMISIHGPVTNLFLTPEPPTAYHHRVHTHHGNKKRQYIDGWVEFKHRRHARACVDALNGSTTADGLGVGAIGGRKGGKGRWYRDDVWSVRYLKGFSWDDLMQSARTEEREREERIRFGLAKEKKERQAFMDGVQHAKVEKTRAAKRKRKHNDRDDDRGSSRSGPTDGERREGKGFEQNEPLKGQSKMVGGDGDVHRVLSKIF